MACQQVRNPSATRVGTLVLFYMYDSDTPSRPTDFRSRFFQDNRANLPALSIPAGKRQDFLNLGPTGVAGRETQIRYPIFSSQRDVLQSQEFRGCDENTFYEDFTCTYITKRIVQAGGVTLLELPDSAPFEVLDSGDICVRNIATGFLTIAQIVGAVIGILQGVRELQQLRTDAAELDRLAADTDLGRLLLDPDRVGALRQRFLAGEATLSTPLIPMRITREGFETINRIVDASFDTGALLADRAETSGSNFEITDLSTMLADADDASSRLVDVLDTLARREIPFTAGLTTDEQLIAEALDIANGLTSGADDGSPSAT